MTYQKSMLTPLTLIIYSNPPPPSSSTRRFSEGSASPNLSPPDILNNSIEILETSCTYGILHTNCWAN